MKFLPYDSKDINYKSIVGAAEDGDTVKFRVLLHNDARPYAVYMVIRDTTHIKEGAPDYHKMEFESHYDENYNWFATELAVKEGIYKYGFCYDSPWGRLKITRHLYCEGIVSNDGKDWQLTVTEKNFNTPQKYKGGIIYQIFPDRFFASGAAKQGVPADRFIQNDWFAKPEYRQINEPKTLGNDYFGGDLRGIAQKLPYLKSLGVSIIYLNPIFEAHSNHRYNTADYLKIDPSLGNLDDFRELCKKAHKNGMSIILDGVFSHTGNDSVYFNRYDRYDSLGAYNSLDSEYKDWYTFKHWPDDYLCWWGVPSLPEVNELNEKYIDFITGDGGVLDYWMKMGADGWRLDVADELPDGFLDKLRNRVKSVDGNALIIGEVWEDATDKISYSVRRRYLRGSQLDSVMNYVFANSVIKFVCGGDGFVFLDEIINISDHYPKQCLDLMMNHIGTHDTPRALTAVSGRKQTGDREWQSKQHLSDEEIKNAKSLLRVAAVLQYTLPGIPSLYYGDEAGVEGYGDPFCRSAFPWGKEDLKLVEFYKKLGQFRRSSTVFAEGDIIPIIGGLGYAVFKRVSEKEEVLVAVNRWHAPENVFIGNEWDNAFSLFGTKPIDGMLTIGGKSAVVLKREK